MTDIIDPTEISEVKCHCGVQALSTVKYDYFNRGMTFKVTTALKRIYFKVICMFACTKLPVNAPVSC